MTSPPPAVEEAGPLSLPALWRLQLKGSAGRTLLASDPGHPTYGEAERRSRVLARGLLAAGAAMDDPSSQSGGGGPLRLAREIPSDALRVQLAEELSKYKAPRKIVRLRDDEVPPLASGKIDINRLRALARTR